MSERQAAILVVDDNDDNRYTLTGRLRREGYSDVAVACNGSEALRRLAERSFDLVLLDVMMPELDGIETLAAMKANSALRHVPVVMISAATDLERVVRCIELGAEDYLPKPFNQVLLRARVGACLEKKRLRDQEQAHLAIIERERCRLTDLLHAILPAAAVVELQATGAVRPQRHDEVAVLYCDVAGFTAYCDTHPPELAVSNLQQLVEKFEALTEAAGLEKLKTTATRSSPLRDCSRRIPIPSPPRSIAASRQSKPRSPGPQAGNCAAGCISDRSWQELSGRENSASIYGGIRSTSLRD